MLDAAAHRSPLSTPTVIPGLIRGPTCTATSRSLTSATTAAQRSVLATPSAMTCCSLPSAANASLIGGLVKAVTPKQRLKFLKRVHKQMKGS